MPWLTSTPPASSSPVRSVSGALMLDPVTAAVCSLEEIDRLFEEMWVAERESLTAFS